MPAAATVYALKLGMLEQSGTLAEFCLRLCRTNAHRRRHLPATREIRALLKPACALWPAGARALPAHSWSSCGCENRASWSAAADWVGTCVLALRVQLLIRQSREE